LYHEFMWNGWLKLLLGIWLIGSPWILGYWKVSAALWSQIIVGVLLVLLSLWQLVGKEDNLS